MWKKIGLSVLGFVAIGAASFGWFYSLIDKSAALHNLEASTPQDVAYLQERVSEDRGRVLMVVTSETRLGDTGKTTGYEHTELARAYYVFTTNGFEVDIASPRGGEPRAIIDDEDMGAVDFAFLNDPIAMSKARNTLPIDSIDSADYEGLFFVGGKGTMWDFPDNAAMQQLVSDHAMRGKSVGAGCHGPAALVNVQLPDGSY
mgnify:CR=1 FL=1